MRLVVTVCSPFRSALDSFFLPLRPVLDIWPSDLEAIAEEIERPLQVPTTAIYSPHDGAVAWESCYDPRFPDDSVAIDVRHVAIATDPAVHAAIVRRLGEPAYA